jgi:hypothetical protein
LDLMVKRHGLQMPSVARSATEMHEIVDQTRAAMLAKGWTDRFPAHAPDPALGLDADNGWEAWGEQHGGGTFTAWACRATEGAVATYIEDSFDVCSRGI